MTTSSASAKKQRQSGPRRPDVGRQTYNDNNVNNHNNKHNNDTDNAHNDNDNDNSIVVIIVTISTDTISSIISPREYKLDHLRFKVWESVETAHVVYVESFFLTEY